VINVAEWLASVLKLRRDVRSEQSYQTDSFRLEAQRIIDAFRAHDLDPNEVARILPKTLVLGTSPSVLGDASELKNHLSEFSPWAVEQLALDPLWVRGKSKKPHLSIHSYKNISELTDFFKAREQDRGDGTEGLIDRYQLHIYKQDDKPLSESTGTFVVLLSEEFAQLDDDTFYRFYYLTEGHFFEHSPCLIHLLQIITVALHHRIFIFGHVMAQRRIEALDGQEGFVNDLVTGVTGKIWHPEDIFFRPGAGKENWNIRARHWVTESMKGTRSEFLLESLPPTPESLEPYR
jgi:hypothetical protein